MKKILIIFLLLNAFTLFSFKNYPHYELDLNVQPEKGIIQDNVDILINWTREQSQKGNYVFLALLLNVQEKRNPKIFSLLEDSRPGGFTPALAECSNIKINSSSAVNVFIPVNGKALYSFKIEHLILRIDVPRDVEIDTTFHLTFDYKVKLSNSLNMDDFY